MNPIWEIAALAALAGLLIGGGVGALIMALMIAQPASPPMFDGRTKVHFRGRAEAVQPQEPL